mgnify:FL=1
MTDAIRQFPRKKARTLRFSCGAPRSARVIADGFRALFLRSDGPEDTVTSLWMSVIDEDGNIGEIPLADPRDCLPTPTRKTFRRKRRRDANVRAKADPASSRIASTVPATA